VTNTDALEPETTVTQSPAARARELLLVRLSILVVLSVMALPYAYGYLSERNGSHFVGQVFSIEDFCVYMSWARQAFDGHLFARNLFTTDPQLGHQINLLFLLIGNLARLTGLPIVAVWFLMQIIGGVTLLWCIYRFYLYIVPSDTQIRLTAFGFVLIGSGFSWLFWVKDHNPVVFLPTADSQQPEALIFPTIYVSALMSISSTLILGTLFCLFAAHRTGRIRFAVCAGIQGLILGSIHSYDVIHISASWIVFMLVSMVYRRKIDIEMIRQAALAGLVALSTIIYQFYQIQHDPVFFKRAFQATTLTLPISFYLVGYGLLAALGVVGSVAKLSATSTQGTADSDTEKWQFLLCWVVAGLGLIYIVPVPFQRKLIMGEAIPLCLVAGVGAVQTIKRYWPGNHTTGLIGLVIFSSISSFVFLYRDCAIIDQYRQNPAETITSPFISSESMDILKWIRTNSKPHESVLAPPKLALFVPGYCDRATFVAHWGETPNCAEKIGQLTRFADANTPDMARIQFLKSTRTTYLCYPNNPADETLTIWNFRGHAHVFVNFSDHCPSYLVPLYKNSRYTIYAIRLNEVEPNSTHARKANEG
jgi:hypothetical protein